MKYKSNIIAKIIAVFLMTFIITSNIVVYAEESWDEFYLRVVDTLSANGNTDSLSDADLDRMIKGPTEDERYGGAQYIDSTALEFPQEKARQIKEARVQSGSTGNNNSGSSGNSGGSSNTINSGNTGSGMTNQEKVEKAKQLRKEIASFCGQDLTKKSEEGIRNCLNKITQYKNTYGGDMDETMMQYWSSLNNELTARNKETDDTIIQNQVNNNGQVVQNPSGSGSSRPSTGVLGSSDASASHTLGEITSEAKGFLSKGIIAIPFNEGNLKEASDTLFNILLGLATAAVVIIGVYLGVKFMMSTVEDKAKVKEALIPYIAGCVVVFGAFTIWKLALLLLENIG